MKKKGKQAKPSKLSNYPEKPIDKKIAPQEEAPPQVDLQEVVFEKMKRIFGTDKLKLRKLPNMEADKPFTVDFSKDDELFIINDGLSGTLESENEVEHIVKNGLRLAEAKKAKAVWLTGDVMYMLTQHHGVQRIYKAQVSGIKLDFKMLEDDCPEVIKKDKGYESSEIRFKKGKPVFITPRQRLELNIRMLRSAFVDKKGKPIYSGQILINFGKMEDELIMFYANEYLRIGFFEARGEAQRKVLELTSEWKKTKVPEVKMKIYEELKEWRMKLNERTMSNISEESLAQARQIVTGYLINKYEEVIPNSKVISLGDTFAKPNGNLVMATTDKERFPYDGKLATRLAQKTESFSKARNPGKIPNVMLGYGPNPYFDAKMVTYQASAKEGDKRMCLIIQLPMAVTSQKYREVVRGQNVLKDFLSRVAKRGGFESGVISLRWNDALSIPIVSVFTSAVLTSKEIFGSDKSLNNFVKAGREEYKMIYVHKLGCTHAGACDVVVYPSLNDPEYRYIKYQQQVAREFLLKAGAPICMCMHDGDATQGYNHDYQKNVHPDDLKPQDAYKEALRIRSSKLSLDDKLKQMMTLLLYQSVRKGVMMPQDQVEEYVKSLDHGLEYFIRILENGRKANLSFEGSLSLILTIMGNHNVNTYKNSKIFNSDAKEISDQLKGRLLDYIIDNYQNNLELMKSLKEIVKEQITAPQYGPLGEARGCMSVNGKKSYAIVLKHKQGKMDKTQERAYRRSIKNFEIGLPMINNSGDDHKGGVRVTRDMLNVKTGCEQGEGSYGREIDGSEQNVFSIVYGVPVGGFACGPIMFMILDAETMRKYAEKPFPVDGKKLFPNSLI